MADDALAGRLRAIFAEELEEQLGQMHAALEALQHDSADPEHLRAIFRVMHTLKGASRAAGVPLIEQVSHALEGDLVRARDTGASLDKAQLALLLEAHDAFAGARERLSAGEPVVAAPLTLLLQRARRGIGATRAIPGAAPAVIVPAVPPASAPQPSPPERQRRSTEDQVRLGVHQADDITAAAGEIAVLATAMGDHATEVRALRARLQARLRPGDDDGLRELDGELGRLTHRAGEQARALASTSARLEGPLRHLRQRPLKDLTDTLERAARDVARDVGKQLEVTTLGESIEADRVVIEALREPLLHLLRNAVDHGIETPAARAAAGKPPEGQIRIAASLRGDRLRLSVTDDGGGLDLSSIQRALERRGSPVPISASALARTIFDDGLSTREAATTLSGRGVGLGIVRDCAVRLGGTADVQSEPGQGTTFVLEVPLSIATLRAVVVAVGGVIVAIPSAFVSRVSAVRTQTLRRVDGRDVMIGAGSPVPLVPLAALLGPPYRSGELGDRAQVVMLEANGQRVAVTVDELLDERELVIRPLEYVGAEAAAATVGVSIMGTGELVLVLSVPSLLAQAARTADVPLTSALGKHVNAPRERILVVDDSITSRTLEQSVLAAAGYDVATAVDGAEAWRMLERSTYALVVSDVEMPHLDGIALCVRIRANPGTAALPVILVTSLDEPAHRARGLEAGADAYVAKSSFDQDALLDTVRLLIGRQDAR